MLFTALGFPGGMSHCSVLALEVPGCCHHDLKAFCETGYNSVLLNITENVK